MSEPYLHRPAAGGVLIAIGAILGAGIGLFTGQPSRDLLIGVGLGVIAALVIWLRDRQR